MSESTTTAPGLTSQYTAQVAEDLERNAKEQERIGAEIAALQEQLTALRQDHAVLVNLREALGLTPAATAPAPAVTPGAPVPAPRKKSGAASGKPAKAPARKAEKSAAKPADKPAARTSTSRSAAKKAPSKARAKTPAKNTGAQKAEKSAPTLVTLVRDHLTGQTEPRSAAEIAAALDKLHPERAVKTTVVRNTLEALVAKDRAHRSKQGSSVFYTAVTAESGAPEQEKQPAQ